ncbi:protein of unknown function [Bradyrhizobium vignae]|uniref:Uncharacterized protein n=1 Tax=Bradyrhizobium vignae TaxID=1549949 RepID=A0A2U3Q9E6_9BRAD|nr:protein of unknown function [Bradyrhizobium vignae]
MFCNNSLHPCYKRSFHNQPSVASAAESERLGGTCASLLENVRINRCSRYLNAYGGQGAAILSRLTSIVYDLRYKTITWRMILGSEYLRLICPDHERNTQA